ncbi:hypothetical protein LOZ51_000478 [Ophidiomyces ophidiicola]|nr:hypothetical protein LOZ51_000478 [Ophidiomyces ophidiicola]
MPKLSQQTSETRPTTELPSPAHLLTGVGDSLTLLAICVCSEPFSGHWMGNGNTASDARRRRIPSDEGEDGR